MTQDFEQMRSELRHGYRELGTAVPDVMAGFGAMHRAAVADGELSRATKELIALAIGGNVSVKKKELSADDQLRRPGMLRVAQLYGQICANCHSGSVHGAPKPGDVASWKPRMKGGVEALYQSTINGVGEMPARGGCGDCTDGDLMSLVDLLIEGVE